MARITKWFPHEITGQRVRHVVVHQGLRKAFVQSTIARCDECEGELIFAPRIHAALCPRCQSAVTL